MITRIKELLHRDKKPKKSITEGESAWFEYAFKSRQVPQSAEKNQQIAKPETLMRRRQTFPTTNSIRELRIKIAEKKAEGASDTHEQAAIRPGRN